MQCLSPGLFSQLRDIRCTCVSPEPYMGCKTAVLLHLSSTLPHGKHVSEFPAACALFWRSDRCAILEKGKTHFWENEPAPLSSSTTSFLLSLSHHPQPAWRILPGSGYTQPARRTPRGWGFTDHDNLHFIALFEQNKMSLPCTAALQRAALKSKIMGEKTPPPRPFLLCLNETGN